MTYTWLYLHTYSIFKKSTLLNYQFLENFHPARLFHLCLIINFQKNFHPACLFHPARLLIFRTKFTMLVYSILLFYSILESSTRAKYATIQVASSCMFLNCLVHCSRWTVCVDIWFLYHHSIFIHDILYTLLIQRIKNVPFFDLNISLIMCRRLKSKPFFVTSNYVLYCLNCFFFQWTNFDDFLKYLNFFKADMLSL